MNEKAMPALYFAGIENNKLIRPSLKDCSQNDLKNSEQKQDLL